MPGSNPSDMTVHLLWLNAGLSCDGDSVSLTAATLPSVEDIVMGAIPGLPKVVPHWPLVDYQVGDDFIQWFWKASAGELDPFVLVVVARTSRAQGRGHIDRLFHMPFHRNRH
jgi:hydrogenase small subunit